MERQIGTRDDRQASGYVADCCRRSAVWLSVALLGAVLSVGCAGTDRVGGSMLSEGAKEARKAPGEKQKLLVAGTPVDDIVCETVVEIVDCSFTDEADYDDRDDDDAWSTRDDESDAPDIGDDDSDWRPDLIGYAYGSTRFGGNALTDARSHLLRIGLTDPHSGGRLHAEVEATLSSVRFSPELATSFTGGLELGGGATVRYDLTPPHTLAGVQLLGGVRAGWLRWDYRNPLWIEDEYGDWEETLSDGVGTLSPFAGVGLSVARVGGLQVGADLIVGMTFFGEHTSHGLANDVFQPTPQTQLRLRLSQSF